jgi:hypothetical protein
LCGDPRHCSLQMDDAHQGAPDTGRAWTRRPKPNRLVEVRSLRLGSDIVRPRLHDAGQHAGRIGAAAPWARSAATARDSSRLQDLKPRWLSPVMVDSPATLARPPMATIPEPARGRRLGCG